MSSQVSRPPAALAEADASRLSSDRVPAVVRDVGFEALLGSMVGRLADAAPEAAEAALGRGLCELCDAFGLAGAGLLERSAEAPHVTLSLESCAGRPAGIRDLVATFSELEVEQLLVLLQRNSPFVLDPSNAEAGLKGICAALSAASFGPALCVRLELAGVRLGALLLLAGEGGGFSSRLLLRLRLLADLVSTALVLRDRRGLAGELTDRQMREFERRNLLAVIERCGWRLQGEQGAARALGLSPSTLRDRMRSFGIRRPR